MHGLGVIMEPQRTAPTTTTNSKLSNTVNDLSKIVDSASTLITSIKKDTATYNPNIAATQYQPGSTPLPQSRPDNTRLLLIGGGIVAAGVVVYLVTRKKKK